jgi:hypothetical protein
MHVDYGMGSAQLGQARFLKRYLMGTHLLTNLLDLLRKESRQNAGVSLKGNFL